MGDEKKWYLIYTKPKFAKRLSDMLDKKGISNYYPLNRVVKKLGNRVRIHHEPLFGNYLFVKMAAIELTSMTKQEGVIGFIYWKKDLVIIREDEVFAIKEFLDTHNNVKLKHTMITHEQELPTEHDWELEAKGSTVETEVALAKLLLPSLGYVLIS